MESQSGQVSIWSLNLESHYLESHYLESQSGVSSSGISFWSLYLESQRNLNLESQ